MLDCIIYTHSIRHSEKISHLSCSLKCSTPVQRLCQCSLFCMRSPHHSISPSSFSFGEAMGWTLGGWPVLTKRRRVYWGLAHCASRVRGAAHKFNFKTFLKPSHGILNKRRSDVCKISINNRTYRITQRHIEIIQKNSVIVTNSLKLPGVSATLKHG